MEMINTLSFFNRNRTVLVCASIVLLLVIIYFESIPNQAGGRCVDDKIKNSYFAIKNSIFDEPEGNEWYAEFKKHAIYKKFKSLYPNSTDNFSVDFYGSSTLEVEQTDSYGNIIYLMIFRGDAEFPFYYHVYCHTDRNIKGDGGAPFESAFDYLDNTKCLLN